MVGEEARVMEEIGLHRESINRNETINDTVRRTEVEIEDNLNAVSSPVIFDAVHPRAPALYWLLRCPEDTVLGRRSPDLAYWSRPSTWWELGVG